MSTRNRQGKSRTSTAGNNNNYSDNKKRKKTRSLDLSGRGAEDDSSVSSRDDDDETPSVVDSESDHEILEVKKVRLAREYLDSIAKGDDESNSGGSDDDDDDEDGDDDEDAHDPVARKLQRQRMQQAGTWKRPMADALLEAVTRRQTNVAQRNAGRVVDAVRDAAQWWVEAGHVRRLSPRGHDLTPTCVALSSTTQRAVSGSKDHSVVLWDVATETAVACLCPRWKNQKLKTTPQGSSNNNNNGRSAGQVCSVAVSEDGRLAAVGRHDSIKDGCWKFTT